MEITYGIGFVRTGKCKRCGACESKVEPCPHLTWKNGLATCEIYDHRGGVCKSCSEAKSIEFGKKWTVSHENCKKFPDSPNCRVVKEGICGFKFVSVKEKNGDSA